MKLSSSLIFLSLCFSLNLSAQKIKYKKLFPLLNAGQYEEARPSLELFLNEHPDHPNANLQMAIMAQKFLNDCPLAVSYYQKSLKLIDDLEVYQNSKYYESYRRRDLRTGKFTIKLSDIRTDLEKKIDQCK